MKIRDMVYIALFASIVGVMGLIPPVPLPFIPVPITLQTLGVMLSGAVLGARLGFLSMLVFVLMVAAGVPLLSGGRGGLGILLGPSGGFVISYPFAAFVIGFLVERFQNHLKVWNVTLFNIIGGIGVIYLFGIPYLAFVSDLPLSTAALGSMAFLPGDLTKAVLAAYLAIRLRRSGSLKFTRNKNHSNVA